MFQHATAKSDVKSWQEQAYDEGEGRPKLTRASVVQVYSGDIVGEGTVEYLMMYRPDSSATYVGLHRITGTLAGRAGSFVVQDTGVFTDGAASGSWHIVAGSGTGDLAGLHGEGGYVARNAVPTEVMLEYGFA